MSLHNFGGPFVAIQSILHFSKLSTLVQAFRHGSLETQELSGDFLYDVQCTYSYTLQKLKVKNREHIFSLSALVGT